MAFSACDDPSKGTRIRSNIGKFLSVLHIEGDVVLFSEE
jgi:hypothetical protein